MCQQQITDLCWSQNQDTAYPPPTTHELALGYNSHHLVYLLSGYFSKMEFWWSAPTCQNSWFFWEHVLCTNLWLMKPWAGGRKTFRKSKQANDHNKLPKKEKGRPNIQPQQTCSGQELKWRRTSWKLCLTRPF